MRKTKYIEYLSEVDPKSNPKCMYQAQISKPLHTLSYKS